MSCSFLGSCRTSRIRGCGGLVGMNVRPLCRTGWCRHEPHFFGSALIVPLVLRLPLLVVVLLPGVELGEVRRPLAAPRVAVRTTGATTAPELPYAVSIRGGAVSGLTAGERWLVRCHVHLL